MYNILYNSYMNILSIDSGIERTGYAVFKDKKYVISALIKTSKEKPTEIRLEEIYSKLKQVFKKYQPDVLAIEELFFTTNAKTAFKVGEARGVITLAGAMQKIPVFSYTPLQIKIAVTGYGHADKSQVGRMIKAILKLKELPKLDDTVDAIAVALTHAFTNKKLR